MGVHAPGVDKGNGIAGDEADQQAASGTTVAVAHDVGIFPGGGGIDAVTIQLARIPGHHVDAFTTDAGGVQAGDRVANLLQVGDEIVNPIHTSYPPSLYVGFTLSLPQ